MTVTGYRRERIEHADPKWLQTAQLAELACGHAVRIPHGHSVEEHPCPECEAPDGGAGDGAEK